MRHKVIAVVLVAALACCGVALAANTPVTSLSYPEKQSVDLLFVRMDTAPAKATLKGSVKYEAGQASIKLSFDNMQPAVLFGGDIAAYVVWAVSSSAPPENLGELIVKKAGQSGSQKFSTPKKDFALMVTAEPYYLVARPFELVLFTSSPKDTKKYSGNTFVFADFRPGPKAGVQSIAGLKFDNKTPVPVLQAETAVGIIERLNAGNVNPDAVKRATVALGEAKSAKSDKSMADASQRSISASADALREWAKTRDQLAAADALAKQNAEKAALAEKNAAEKAALEAQNAKTTEKLGEAEQQKALLKQQRDQIAADALVIAQQRDQLAARLQSALGAVASTKSTARGTVTSLSGVLFATGQATLKPEAKLALAKLAGVMLVFSKTTMEIEGHTDNTGTEATNMKLSAARAQTVMDFLKEQGIDAGRMKSSGKGPADPVASNDTPDGRSQNRRVEIISSEPAL
jgi:outer membrane protein OmpA-like peptidoglycan-associated protein